MFSLHLQLARDTVEDLQDGELKQGSVYLLFSKVVFH